MFKYADIYINMKFSVITGGRIVIYSEYEPFVNGTTVIKRCERPDYNEATLFGSWIYVFKSPLSMKGRTA